MRWSSRRPNPTWTTWFRSINSIRYFDQSLFLHGDKTWTFGIYLFLQEATAEDEGEFEEGEQEAQQEAAWLVSSRELGLQILSHYSYKMFSRKLVYQFSVLFSNPTVLILSQICNLSLCRQRTFELDTKLPFLHFSPICNGNIYKRFNVLGFDARAFPV